MSRGRLPLAAAQKGLALGASFVNVVFAAAALPVADALLYLSMLSLVQLTIPFAGLGLGQRMVRLREDAGAMPWKVRPWFHASILLGLGLLVLQTLRSDAGPKGVLFALVAVLLVHIAHAEWVRTAQARQMGFFIYNLSMLAIAGIFVVTGTVSPLALLPALVALAVLLVRERALFFGGGGEPCRPNRTDITTAFRVISVNQFYNVIVVLLSLIAASPAILTLVLVWRFAMFFNWQTFYWMRFGHKDTIDGATPERMAENRRVNRLNWAACGSLAVALLAVFPGGMLGYLQGTPFDARFFALLALYGAVRTAINLIFPHELFAIYRGSDRQNLGFLALAGLSFTAIALAALILQSPFALLLLVEAVALGWRLRYRAIA